MCDAGFKYSLFYYSGVMTWVVVYGMMTLYTFNLVQHVEKNLENPDFNKKIDKEKQDKKGKKDKKDKKDKNDKKNQFEKAPDEAFQKQYQLQNQIEDEEAGISSIVAPLIKKEK